MNQAYIVPLLALALVTTAGYFYGRKKNRWISGWISREAEDVLKPVDSNYVNFGGTIGYNYVYKLRKPFREAKGTFTLLPRQSVLYMPISLLVNRYDKFYMQLFADGKLAGEGHIVARSYLSRAKNAIDGYSGLTREDVDRDGKSYVLLWDSRGMDEKLKKLLDSVRHPELLRHFCCYADNKNFFLYLRPVKDKFGEILESITAGLKPFYLKGGFSDGPGNETEN
jgi:hypothetical protein